MVRFLASLRILVAAALVAAVPAQSPPANLTLEELAQTSHADRLHVKLVEGSGAELRNGALLSRTGVDLSAAAALFARAAAEPLFTAMSWDELDRLHAQACSQLPEGRRPGHLGLWFRLRTRSAAAAVELREALAACPLVLHVYHEPKYVGAAAAPRPDDIPPTTPLLTSMQTAHELPPLGHGVRRVQGVYGARGRDVGLRMIESSWILDHEDVEQLVAANFLGAVPPVDLIEALHGLSGTSIVVADRNGYGLTGLADEMQARFLAMELNGGVENSLLLAMAACQPGDVVLVVLMVLVPGLGPGSWLPMEFFQASFDATLTVTASGRHVVIPAGNGSRSLDDPALLHRFDRAFRDSGSIIVSASDAGLPTRATFANWGSRVDAHSWGAQVAACGYGSVFFGNNDYRQSYTASATGTSSSTPHLAAIVGVLQGAAKKQLGHVLTNAEVLTLLHTHGMTTPDVIGLRPDLPAMFTALGIFDGLDIGVSEVGLGGNVTFEMSGPAGSLVALFGSLDTADLDLGFNRHLHLDLATMASLGAFVLPNGTAAGGLAVPTTASLLGVHVYFQAARLPPVGSLHITNSCHVTIL